MEVEIQDEKHTGRVAAVFGDKDSANAAKTKTRREWYFTRSNQHRQTRRQQYQSKNRTRKSWYCQNYCEIAWLAWADWDDTRGNHSHRTGHQWSRNDSVQSFIHPIWFLSFSV